MLEEEGRRSKGDTWWWYEEVKEAISSKEDAHKTIVEIALRRMRTGMEV